MATNAAADAVMPEEADDSQNQDRMVPQPASTNQVCKWCVPNGAGSACDQLCTTGRELRLHIWKQHMKGRSHKSRKPQDAGKCRCLWEGCGKTYKSYEYLYVHLRQHTGELPFICNHQGCGRAFTRASNLRNHKKWHPGGIHFKSPKSGCSPSSHAESVSDIEQPLPGIKGASEAADAASFANSIESAPQSQKQDPAPSPPRDWHPAPPPPRGWHQAPPPPWGWNPAPPPPLGWHPASQPPWGWHQAPPPPWGWNPAPPPPWGWHQAPPPPWGWNPAPPPPWGWHPAPPPPWGWSPAPPPPLEGHPAPSPHQHQQDPGSPSHQQQHQAPPLP
ncbi:metal regulatory transcription factor 1-like [Sycon ciliatum]|uniref:metal regulatory transcription factor 1-like n=1 Tax=Sycon ciliatum TaxID=27933 RepID=UPI0031F6F669